MLSGLPAFLAVFPAELAKQRGGLGQGAISRPEEGGVCLICSVLHDDGNTVGIKGHIEACGVAGLQEYTQIAFQCRCHGVGGVPLVDDGGTAADLTE